jgi:hypothetical protein
LTYSFIPFPPHPSNSLSLPLGHSACIPSPRLASSPRSAVAPTSRGGAPRPAAELPPFVRRGPSLPSPLLSDGCDGAPGAATCGPARQLARGGADTLPLPRCRPARALLSPYVDSGPPLRASPAVLRERGAPAESPGAGELPPENLRCEVELKGEAGGRIGGGSGEVRSTRRALMTVYFGTPNMFNTLWFGFDYGTNPPLGTLII